MSSLRINLISKPYIYRWYVPWITLGSGKRENARARCVHPPDVIQRRSFTRLSTALAVIEGLGTRLCVLHDMKSRNSQVLFIEKFLGGTSCGTSSIPSHNHAPAK